MQSVPHNYGVWPRCSNRTATAILSTDPSLTFLFFSLFLDRSVPSKDPAQSYFLFEIAATGNKGRKGMVCVGASLGRTLVMVLARFLFPTGFAGDLARLCFSESSKEDVIRLCGFSFSVAMSCMHSLGLDAGRATGKCSFADRRLAPRVEKS